MSKSIFRVAAFAAALISLSNVAAAGPSSGIVQKLYVPSGVGAVTRTQGDKMKESLSVLDFGAKGDCVTDDTQAWRKAVAALGGRGRLLVPRPAACYKITDTIAIGTRTTDTNIIIDAEPGTLVKSYVAGTAALFDIKNLPGHFNLSGIRGLRMQSVTVGAGIALKLNGQCFGSFDDLYVEGFGTGVMLSNEGGAGVFTEFVRFNRLELHSNNVGVGMYKKDGDISFHGISFNDSTVNVGAGQVGLDITDASWYNASFNFRMFANDPTATVLRMTTTAPYADKGVFGDGSITVEGPSTGPATISGNGRFWFDGSANFMSGVTDSLTPLAAWEPGFSAKNYIKTGQAFGSSGYNVAPVKEQTPAFGRASNGPYGTFTRLTGSNVEALLANSFAAHASAAGNGFYTGYTGYQGAYSAGKLGWFLASDGTEIKSYAPSGTAVSFTAGGNGNAYGNNQAFSIKDGNFYVGSAHIAAGSGNPNGAITGSPGDMYLNRLGGTGQTLWIKESGSGTNTGWVAK